MSRSLKVLPWALGVLALVLAAVVVVRSGGWSAPQPSATAAAVSPPSWGPTAGATSPDSLLQAALERQASGDLEGAVVDFGRVLDEDPDAWLALEARADCLEVLGRKDEAVADLQRLLVQQPDRTAARVALARLHLALGHRDLARQAAESLAARSPGVAFPWFVFSEIRAESDPKAALEDIENYIRLAYQGTSKGDGVRASVEDPDAGVYLRRLRAYYEPLVPAGPDHEARLELEIRWHAVTRYADMAPLAGLQSAAAEHLIRYELLARTHGDPDTERFARAAALRKRFDADIEEGRMPGAAEARPDPASQP